MDPLKQLARLRTAETRLHNILRAHGVANDRILEQKISDSGPINQRVDPHVLTSVRNRLVKNGDFVRIVRNGTPWYCLASADTAAVEARLATLHALHRQTQDGAFANRIGQVLEIAVYRALASQTELHYYGGFRDLDHHDDSTNYSKNEPPDTLSGNSIHPKNLDFLVHTPDAVYAGIEVKNIRQWIYPNRPEIRDVLYKCCVLDVVPVLIARRIHYSTFSVLNPCGVLIHQTYNQLYPTSDAALAAAVRQKDTLGYHDVRTGNTPDARLVRFIQQHLPALLPDARNRFDAFKDLLRDYATERHAYKSFAARVKRRRNGQPEDGLPVEDPDEWEV